MSPSRHTDLLRVDRAATVAARESRALIDAAHGLRRAAHTLPVDSPIAADLQAWADAMARAAVACRAEPSAALSAGRPRGCSGVEERDRRRHAPTE